MKLAVIPGTAQYICTVSPHIYTEKHYGVALFTCSF